MSNFISLTQTSTAQRQIVRQNQVQGVDCVSCTFFLRLNPFLNKQSLPKNIIKSKKYMQLDSVPLVPNMTKRACVNPLIFHTTAAVHVSRRG